MSRYTYERPFILEGDWIVCTVTIRHGETASNQNARAARIIRALGLADAIKAVPTPATIQGPFAAQDDEVADSIGVLMIVASGGTVDSDTKAVAVYLTDVLNLVAAYKAGE